MPRRWMPLGAAAALLLIVGLGAVSGSLPLHPAPLARPQPNATWDPHLPTEGAHPVATVGAAARRIEVPWALALAARIFCVLLVAGLVGLLLFFVIRGAVRRAQEMLPPPPIKGPQVETAREIRAAVDRGLVELDDTDADPRKVVIACWVRLEAAADAAGMPRRPGDTSTDMVVRLLADRAVTASVLNDFAGVYREARYSPHTVDVTMRDQARAALRLLRDELTVPAGTAERGSATA